MIKSGLCIDRELYRQECESYYSHLADAKSRHLREEIAAADTKQLFNIIKRLTIAHPDSSLPDHTSNPALANQFAEFFDNKINLLTNESYDIVITGYNEAGFSAAPRKHVVDPEHVKPKSVAGGSALPVIVSIPIAMLVLIPMVLYVLYQKLKKNLNRFPEPVFTKTDQVKVRPGPEPEVFDQPTCAGKTEKEMAVQIHLSQEYVTVVPSTADVPIAVKDRAASHQKQGYSQLSMECISYAQIRTAPGGNGSTSPSSTANGVKDSSEEASPVSMLTTSTERLAIDNGDTQHYISPERSTQGEGYTRVHPEVDKTKPTITSGLHLNGSPTGDAQGSSLSEEAPDAKSEISSQSAAASSYVPYQQKVSQMETDIPVPVILPTLCQTSGGYVDPEALTHLTSVGTGKSIGDSEITLDDPNASPMHTVIDHVSTSAEWKSGCRGSSDELQSSLLEDMAQNASFVDDSTPLITDRDQHRGPLQSPQKYVSRAPVARIENNESPTQLTENLDATFIAGHEMSPPHSGYVSQTDILLDVMRNPAQQPCEMGS
ncbi:uncharacterized protein [Diadema antillarum]|uniref:uncharacterized protein n=1 Tax=Diadema antillarum TaxID=105358 RepID=UPI003A87D2B5